MTEEQRHLVVQLADDTTLSEREREAVRAYDAAFERMRQFIRNLADESRVYLESEE